MHDPMTVAFTIKRPWPEWSRSGGRKLGELGWYWPTWITIWHVDPERDGSDDSCGWFPRARHGDPEALRRIERDFEFYWDRNQYTWFRPGRQQQPQLSTLSIVLHMFRIAARAVHDGRRFDPHGWRGARRFMRRHLSDVLEFAENPLDSMRPFIEQVDGRSDESREQRIKRAAAIVYGCMLRWSQPWYQHARWHVWHWEVQIHPLQAFKRWAFSRCAKCGRRFAYGYAPVAYHWNGTGPLWFRSEAGVYHSDCSRPGEDGAKSATATQV